MLLYLKGPALAQVVRGEKRATVRLWKTCKLQPGHVLVFNGRVRCRLTAVEPRTIATLSDDDARAAGHPGRAALRRTLLTLYPGATLASPCIVLRFASPTE